MRQYSELKILNGDPLGVTTTMIFGAFLGVINTYCTIECVWGGLSDISILTRHHALCIGLRDAQRARSSISTMARSNIEARLVGTVTVLSSDGV